jgi:hypothetical protein
MKSEGEKVRQQQLKKAFKREGEKAFFSSLPMEASDFLDLFDTLNEKLGDEPCDDTLRFTEQFLNEHQLPLQDVALWLNEHGGHCDCEVLSNVEEKFEDL